MTVKKRLVFIMVALFLFFVVLEAFALLGLYALEHFHMVRYRPIQYSLTPDQRTALHNIANRRDEDYYLGFDVDLGWSPIPNRQVDTPTATYNINSQGFRSLKDHSVYPEPGTLRIAAMGDSYGFAMDVDFKESWHENLASYFKNAEVLNFGVPGYGLDQAYLRYEKSAQQFHPDITLLCFMSENINRNMNVFRPFYEERTIVPFTKPHFKKNSDALSLVLNPLQSLEEYQTLLQSEQEVISSLGRDDYYRKFSYNQSSWDKFALARLSKILWTALRIWGAGENIVNYWDYSYNTEHEAFGITKGIFDQFYSSSMDSGSQPIMVLFPRRWDLIQFRNVGKNIFEPLEDYFDRKGYSYVNMIYAFDRYGSKHEIQDFFVKEHYNALGNQIVAQGIYDLARLEKWGN